MALQIRVEVGSSYEGQRWFALENEENKKKDPGVKDTTPKLLIETKDLPSSWDTTDFEPGRIPNPTAAVAGLKELYVSKDSRAVFGIEATITVRQTDLLLVGKTSKRPAHAIELGGLGKLNRQLEWELSGWIFDDERRHRCALVIGEIPPPASSGPSPAVVFTSKFYSKQLDPRPLKP